MKGFTQEEFQKQLKDAAKMMGPQKLMGEPDRIDLTDVTFVIPIRVDSEARKENFDILIHYLTKHFNTNILVVESDVEEKVPKLPFYTKVFIESEHCHRTKMLNMGFRLATTPYVVNQDVDCLFKIEAYLDALKNLKENPDCVFSFPYDGNFRGVSEEQKKEISSSLSVENVSLLKTEYMHHASVGGAFFANKKLYLEIGGENPNYQTWGNEDNDRIVRAEKFGYKIMRSPYVLYHLPHPRVGNFYHPQNNGIPDRPDELQRIMNMGIEELKAYIATWNKE